MPGAVPGQRLLCFKSGMESEAEERVPIAGRQNRRFISRSRTSGPPESIS